MTALGFLMFLLFCYKMGGFWLCIGGDETDDVRPWKGTEAIEEDRELDYKFRIKLKNHSYTISGGKGYKWKLAINKTAVTSNNKDGLDVGFVKREMGTYSTEFKLLMDMSFGEDAFQLNCAWSDEKIKRIHQLKINPQQSRICLNKSREVLKTEGAGLTIGEKDHTFIIAHKW